LTGVSVVDIITAPDGTRTTNAVTSGVTVAPGAIVALGPLTITPTDCGPYQDFFLATANGLCSDPAPQTSQVCTTTNLCAPCIGVTKLVACGGPGPNPQCNGLLSYGPSATGVAGTNNPAFCYQIIVTNCGVITLTNVQVSDPTLGLAVTLPNLAPGTASAPIYAGTSWPLGNHTNVVTATGQSAANGASVSATNTAVAVVVPASVSCSLSVSNDFNLDSPIVPSHVLLPTNAPVTVQLIVNNTGSSDLTVSIGGLPPLFDCASGAAVPVPATVDIPAGGSTNYTGCVDVACPNGLQLRVTVQGTALASTDIPCVYDSNGSNITTAASSCSASVSCQTPVTCRVTGGGTLYTNTFSTNCIVVPTTLFDDLADSAGLILDHVSHGGQLGAPFSHQDCAIRLGDPCIRGQWQHVRHYKNGANGNGNQPQDVFDMSFHSNTPKGVFDTLDCACLGCCSPTGIRQPDGNFFGLSNRFNLCNPDDHRVCGPMPRPSPANAIIFSGIGTFTPATNNVNGRAAASRYVVFRVYIEDRSEPGGAHPGGAIMPADIYCFEAWDTGIATAKRPDFSSVAAEFRTALSADSCAFLAALSSGGLPQGSLPSTTVGGLAADVVDCGPLHDGNQQIHPSTSATCTTESIALSPSR
jgi:hypothetical protein